MGVSFLNYSQTPLVSPLHKSMKIEIYNDMNFQPIKVSVNRDIKYESSNQVGSKVFKLHQNESKILSLTELFQ